MKAPKAERLTFRRDCAIPIAQTGGGPPLHCSSTPRSEILDPCRSEHIPEVAGAIIRCRRTRDLGRVGQASWEGDPRPTGQERRTPSRSGGRRLGTTPLQVLRSLGLGDQVEATVHATPNSADVEGCGRTGHGCGQLLSRISLWARRPTSRSILRRSLGRHSRASRSAIQGSGLTGRPSEAGGLTS
jgi:hypothetical protein